MPHYCLSGVSAADESLLSHLEAARFLNPAGGLGIPEDLASRELRRVRGNSADDLRELIRQGAELLVVHHIFFDRLDVFLPHTDGGYRLGITPVLVTTRRDLVSDGDIVAVMFPKFCGRPTLTAALDYQI